MTPYITHPDNEFLRHYLPYGFLKLSHSRFKHVYLPVNRGYRPLGVIDGDIDLKTRVNEAFVFDSDPHSFKGVWHDALGLFLYGDAPESRSGYGVRLGRLLRRRMRILGQIR